MLRLLFVNDSLTLGGSERAMSIVAEEMARRGHQVSMVLLKDAVRTYPVSDSIRIVQLSQASGGLASVMWRRVRDLRRVMRTERYDYVVSFMWLNNVPTLLASIGLGLRVVVSERVYQGTAHWRWQHRLIERLSYRLAHRIVYQTEFASRWCPPELRSKSVVVPNMIRAQPLGQLQNRANGSDEKRFVAAGRLVDQKNFALLIEAFAAFSRVHPGWVLEIYGDGMLKPQLSALANQLGVEGQVRFLGYVSDLDQRLIGAAAYVLSSDYEGISNSLAEAMDLGLPVISTDCPSGGSALLIEDRVSGLLTPVGDAPALARAMGEIAADPEFARRMAAGARQSVDRFRPERLGSLWEERVFVPARITPANPVPGSEVTPDA